MTELRSVLFLVGALAITAPFGILVPAGRLLGREPPFTLARLYTKVMLRWVEISCGIRYEVTGWELFAPIRPLYEAGRYDEAADRARELVDAHPEFPGLAYNLACCESLAGRKEDAIEHLRVAIEARESTREFAAGDSDFDTIRDAAAFRSLVRLAGP
jgi:tetratricopeptide (TPR) repeat protein